MTNPELRSDIHSIEPIPDADRDSTGPQQMWIWAGANIAPVNWALGALGIILKLGLWETIAVIVIGNLFGCAIFAAFTVMGHKTGVNQMVLSRSAFGRRGAYLPSLLMFLMTLGWIGVNTYFPVKISMAILGQFGIPDSLVVTFIVITLVMVMQVVIGIYGFYAIRTFEKYTVPATVAIMVLMSVLAWSQPGVVNWNLASTLPPGAHLAMLTLLMSAIGVGWGISWVTWASDYSRFVPRSVSSTSVFWYSYIGMFVPSVWLAILGATIASVTLDTDPAKMVSAVFGGVASILVLLMVLHGPIATNILNVYSAALAALSMGIRLSRTALALIVGIVGYLVTIYFIFAPSFAKAFDNWMISLLLWMSPWAGVVMADFFIKRKSQIDVAELYASPETSAYGDINWGGIIAFLAGLVAGWSVQDGLVPALQGPISGLLGGADLSWLFGIVVSGVRVPGSWRTNRGGAFVGRSWSRQKMTRERFPAQAMRPGNYRRMAGVHKQVAGLSDNRDKPAIGCWRYAHCANLTEEHDVFYLLEDFDHRRDRDLPVCGLHPRIESGRGQLPFADTAGPDDGAHRQSGAARHASAQRRRIRGRGNQRRRRHRRQEAGADDGRHRRFEHRRAQRDEPHSRGQASRHLRLDDQPARFRPDRSRHQIGNAVPGRRDQCKGYLAGQQMAVPHPCPRRAARRSHSGISGEVARQDKARHHGGGRRLRPRRFQGNSGLARQAQGVRRWRSLPMRRPTRT